MSSGKKGKDGSKSSSKEDSPAGALVSGGAGDPKAKEDAASSSGTTAGGTGGSGSGGTDKSNGGPGAVEDQQRLSSQPGSKPGSAGATAREAAQRLLGVATRGEWSAADQLLKTLEKAVQSQPEDSNFAPLAGLMDPVGLPSFVPYFFLNRFSSL